MPWEKAAEMWLTCWDDPARVRPPGHGAWADPVRAPKSLLGSKPPDTLPLRSLIDCGSERQSTVVSALVCTRLLAVGTPEPCGVR